MTDTITHITKDKPPFYLLTLSSGKILHVSEDTLINYRLLKGQEISDELINHIEKSNHFDSGLELALNYLSYQLRSEKEIFDYLRQKEYSVTDCQKIIERLKQLQLINDKTYSESYVRTAIQMCEKGPQLIQQYLKKKGIDETLIQQALFIFTPDEQISIANHIVEKSIKRYQNKSFKEAIQKIKVYLFQRGFKSEIIDLVMDNFQLEKDEEQEKKLLKKYGDQLWEKSRKLGLAKQQIKVKQGLFRKGFDYELIQTYINEKELEEENDE